MITLIKKECLRVFFIAASLLTFIFFSLSVYAESGRSDYDLDNDGLIEINDLSDLDEIRNNLDGKSLYDSSVGCPEEGCSGFELTQNLDFDTSKNDKNDESDSYWNANADGVGEGWEPIGKDGAVFKAKFYGNQFEILNLYINRSSEDSLGLFGRVSDAEIKGVGLVGPLTYIKGRNNVGILIGLIEGGSIVSQAYTSGKVEGYTSVGGLVGRIEKESNIKFSFSAGGVTGSHELGGLAGYVGENIDIKSTYSTSAVNGKYQAGGLIGALYRDNVVSDSFSVGKVGGLINIGGLIGNNYSWTSSPQNRIKNSFWAIDSSGQVASSKSHSNMGYQGYPISVLQCFISEEGSSSENCLLPEVSDPIKKKSHPLLSWDQELIDGVEWKFGASNQLPTLTISRSLHRDSDGDGVLDSYDAFPYLAEASVDQDSDGYPDRWNVSCELACQANSGLQLDNLPSHKEVWKDLDLDGLVDEWPAECKGVCRAATGLTLDTNPHDSDNDGIKNTLDNDDNGDGIVDIDSDSDGLIDIDSLEGLNAIRYNLTGSGFQESQDSFADNSGCPLSIVEGVYKRYCLGYELITDLDFDTNQDEKITSNDLYWIDGLGWKPIGSSENQFSAIFDGNGHEIKNLQISRWEERCVGLFNSIDSAVIKNLNISGGLTRIHGYDQVGAIAGCAATRNHLLNISVKADVRSTYSHTQALDSHPNGTGGLIGYAGNFNRIEYSRFSGYVRGIYDVGGLVGQMNGDNSISRSFALGPIRGGGRVGGLVGVIWDENVEISSSFYSGYIHGNYEIGGLVGKYLGFDRSLHVNRALISNSFSASYPYHSGSGNRSFRKIVGNENDPKSYSRNSYWTNDHIESIRVPGFEEGEASYAVKMAALQCPTKPNESQNNDCVRAHSTENEFPLNTLLYQGWKEERWDFGGIQELPGLKISGYIYRDSDADGVLDDEDAHPFDSDNDGFDNVVDAFPANAMAAVDTDNDGQPDELLVDSCYLLPESNFPIYCHLTLDKDDDNDGVEDGFDAFPLLNAASIDKDLDGYPDSWNEGCSFTCQRNSGLELDAHLNDADNDGIKTELDQDDNNDGVDDIDIDSDGLIEISSITQLNAVRYQLDGSGYRASSVAELDNSGCPVVLHNNSYERRCSGYELTQDLDFSEKGESLDYALGWLPIGGGSKSFSGVFDGSGKSIRNLMINRPEESYVGLFGKLYQASIRNLNLESVSVIGRSSVGGVSGYADHSEIVSSSVEGVVSGEWGVGGLLGNANNSVFIRLSHTEGVVRGSSSNIGGLLGLLNANSMVASSYSLSRVEGSTYTVGGLVGRADYNNHISTSFSSSEVVGGGGLIGSLGKRNEIRDVFSSGSLFLSTNTHSIAGIVSYVRSSSSIKRALCVRDIKGGAKSGGLVVSLEGLGDQVTNSYWSIDRSMQASSGGENKSLYYHGLDLKSLQCPMYADSNKGGLDCLSANDRSRSDLFSSQPFYKDWDVAYENGVNVWDFGSEKELPGLVINNVIYRDSDGDGILDSNDIRRFDSDNDGFDNELDDFKFHASAYLDADNDGKPDFWLDACDEVCQKSSGLTLDLDDDNDGVEDSQDSFPDNFAAFVDNDKDGLPDMWNPACDFECRSASGLTLDELLGDTDNDGTVNTLDEFPQNADAAVDDDHDGLADVWNESCDLTCQDNSLLAFDILLSDTDNDSVDNEYDHFIKNSAASQDTDLDGKPDNWHSNCNVQCRAESGLLLDMDDDNDGVFDIVDAFPLVFAASRDMDDDGFPDYWHSDCGSECRSKSKLILDVFLFDSDNDGVKNEFDSFVNNPAASLDVDGDGFPDEWHEYCDLDCQVASQLTLDGDDDNDGVRDENDAFPNDPSEFLDTDGDGVGNNTDLDDDNDGVLDANDSDMGGDNGSPELIQVPKDLRLQVNSSDGAHAVLIWSREQTSQFRAFDAVDLYDLTYEVELNGVSIDSSDGVEIELPSGSQELLWRAKDGSGNYSDYLSQRIDVYPQARFSQFKSITGDKSQAGVEVSLTGDSPEYPLEVMFKVILDKSDAYINQADFTGEFDIESTHSFSIAGPCGGDCDKPSAIFQIPIEKNTIEEVDERLTLRLIAVKGITDFDALFVIDDERREHELTIAHENLAPEVTLVLERDGKVVTNPILEKGVVAVRAVIDDKNDLDRHNIDWDMGGIESYSIVESTVYVETSGLSSGDYLVSVRVSDLVEGSLTGSAETTLSIGFVGGHEGGVGVISEFWIFLVALLFWVTPVVRASSVSGYKV